MTVDDFLFWTMRVCVWLLVAELVACVVAMVYVFVSMAA